MPESAGSAGPFAWIFSLLRPVCASAAGEELRLRCFLLCGQYPELFESPLSSLVCQVGTIISALFETHCLAHHMARCLTVSNSRGALTMLCLPSRGKPLGGGIQARVVVCWRRGNFAYGLVESLTRSGKRAKVMRASAGWEVGAHTGAGRPAVRSCID